MVTICATGNTLRQLSCKIFYASLDKSVLQEITYVLLTYSATKLNSFGFDFLDLSSIPYIQS